MWRSKFERLRVELEILEKKKCDISSQHKWSALNDLEKEDMIICNAWNNIPDSSDQLEKLAFAVLSLFKGAGLENDSFPIRESRPPLERSCFVSEEENSVQVGDKLSLSSSKGRVSFHWSAEKKKLTMTIDLHCLSFLNRTFCHSRLFLFFVKKSFIPPSMMAVGKAVFLPAAFFYAFEQVTETNSEKKKQ
ncbi:unnamed protein product [Nezara viridula]|uniref:Uncharacterized protein n=1 Tax=Nezara viridula TaxID=85310 RepID=A0A9P0H4L4_NEZVI|nr:unnamed protein product [Nezara viridula]